MKLLRAVTIGLLLLAGTNVLAQSDAEKALEKLKSLVGTWQGKTAKGQPVEDTFSLTAGGTAVMGDDRMGSEEMLSLFYVDGNRLLMTHFCPSGNQPRMQATISPDLKTISFDFLDDTNLPSPGTCTMQSTSFPTPTTTARNGPGCRTAKAQLTVPRCSEKSDVPKPIPIPT